MYVYVLHLYSICIYLCNSNHTYINIYLHMYIYI